MEHLKHKLIFALSSVGVMFYSPHASAQIITLGDAISALLNLDATVTVLGQDVLDLSTDVATQGGLLAAVDGQVLSNTADIANLQVTLGGVNTQVGLNTGEIANLQTNLTALTGQVGGNTGNIANLQVDLSAIDAQVGINTGSISGLQTDLAVVTGQLGANTGNIVNLQAGLAANVLRDDGQDTAIGTLSAGLAANVARDDGQDNAITTLSANLAANAARDDNQDGAIAAIGTSLAANTARDDAQDVRLAYNEAALSQHDARITEARQIGSAALVTATQVRDDIESGRVGLVRTESDGSLAIASTLGGSAVSFAGTSGNRRLSGIASGLAADDAATMGQLQTTAAATLAAAQDYTDGKLVGINNSFLARIAENNQELRTEINAAAASTAALAGLPQAFVPGRGMLAMGMGGKGNQAAIAIGVGKAFNHPNVPVVRAGAAINTGNGDVTYNAAVGIHF